MLRNRVADGDLCDSDRADIELRPKLLLAHAKLRGWLVDKKQVSKMNVAVKAISPKDIETYLQGALSEIAPEHASRLKQIAQGELVDEKEITES